jgi:methyl-accepting chemotaxis protein
MNSHSSMKIGTKLAISFGAIIFLILVSALLSMLQARQVAALVKEQNVLRTEKLERLYVTRAALAQTGLAARNAFIFDNDVDAAKELDILDRQKDMYLDALNALTPGFKGRPDFDKMRQDLLLMAEELKRPRQFREAKQMEEFGKFLVTECSPLRRKIVLEIDQVIESVQKEVDAGSQRVEQSSARSQTIILSIAGLAIILGVGIAVVITRGLIRQLGGEPGEVSAIASRIAAGDLTAPIHTRPGDQSSITYAMREMRDGLVQIVGRIRSGAETMTSASSEIARGNLDLSTRTEEQAGALEETASSMEELTSTVKQNADNARQANQLAVTASEVAVKGGAVVSEVVQTMGDINESAKRIVDIIGVIDGIAFQTNILALNAAVEAARAGEQGRGFAVVASEVRNLAQRSAAAAKEIKALIDNSVQKVDVGSKLVDQAGSTMQEVVESIKRVTDIMAEISSASHEQTAGIEQVNQAIVQMDQATQQNAALVEEAAAAAQSMREQAQGLGELVGTFKVDAASLVSAAPAASAAPRRAAVAAASTAAPAARAVQAARTVATPPARKASAAALAQADVHGDWEEF